MVKAETVEGKVTAYYKNDGGVLTDNNNGSVTVDGTKYNYNWIFANGNDIALGDTLTEGNYLLNKSIYSFYLDDCGNVIGVKVKEDAISDYAYVIAVGHDSFGKNNIVKVLTSDGKIGTYTVSSKSDVIAYAGNTAAEEYPDTYASAGEIYAYSINSNNEIVLDKVQDLNSNYKQILYSENGASAAGKDSGTYAFTQGKITGFTKGYSVITTTAGVVYATDSTVFVYRNGSTVTTYVGKSNAPSITVAGGVNASVVRNRVAEDGKTVDYATYVVIESKPENTMTDNYLYVTGGYYGTTQDVNGDTVYLYKTIKDGAVVNLAMDANTYGAGVYLYGMDEARYTGDSANSVEAGLYSLTAATEGYVGGGTTGDYKKNVVIGVSSNDNVIVTPANNDQFVISPDTEITDISNLNDIVTDASFKIGDTIIVVYKTVSGLQVADAIYITGKTAVTTVITNTVASGSSMSANGAYADTGSTLGNCGGATTEKMLAFKYDTTGMPVQDVTLTLVDSNGTMWWTETLSSASAGVHYFFNNIDGAYAYANGGTGKLATTKTLAAGNYSYAIMGSVSGMIMTGTFTYAG